jgi:hypothetical protein
MALSRTVPDDCIVGEPSHASLKLAPCFTRNEFGYSSGKITIPIILVSFPMISYFAVALLKPFPLSRLTPRLANHFQRHFHTRTQTQPEKATAIQWTRFRFFKLDSVCRKGIRW